MTKAMSHLSYLAFLRRLILGQRHKHLINPLLLVDVTLRQHLLVQPIRMGDAGDWI